MIIKAFSKEYFKNLKDIRKHNIIFFNGCFDIIHPGHLKLIKYAKEKSRGYNNVLLICALNSDESVKLQNKSHPLVNDEQSRAKMLELLGIDNIIIFDEKSPLLLIKSLIPDLVITTSSYYNVSNLYDDLQFCKLNNIYVDYIPILADYSTTSIYNKIAEQTKKEIRDNI